MIAAIGILVSLTSGTLPEGSEAWRHRAPLGLIAIPGSIFPLQVFPLRLMETPGSELGQG